jgi:hypothetical protein
MSVGRDSVLRGEGHRSEGSARRVVAGRRADGHARTDAGALRPRPDGARTRVPPSPDPLGPHVRDALSALGGPARRSAPGGGGPDRRTWEDRPATSWGPSRPGVWGGGRLPSRGRAQAWRVAVTKGRGGSERRRLWSPGPARPEGPGRPSGPRPEGLPVPVALGRARRSPGAPTAPAYHFIGEGRPCLKPSPTGFRGRLYFEGCPRAGGGVPQAPGAPIV